MDVTAPRPVAVPASANDAPAPLTVHEAPLAADAALPAQATASDSSEKDTSEVLAPPDTPHPEQEQKKVAAPNGGPAGIIVGTIFGMVVLSAIAIAIYLQG